MSFATKFTSCFSNYAEIRRRQEAEEVEEDIHGLFRLRNTPRRASQSAKKIQQEFCDWCNSPEGAISFAIRDH